MSNTLASCEVVEGVSNEGGKGDIKEDKNFVSSNGATEEVNVVNETPIKVEDVLTCEDDGEASDESMSRRESTSSRDGTEDDVTINANNTGDHGDNNNKNTHTNELENTQTTPRKKKKKRRSRRKTHSRSSSKQISSPDLTTHIAPTNPPDTTETIQITQPSEVILTEATQPTTTDTLPITSNGTDNNNMTTTLVGVTSNPPIMTKSTSEPIPVSNNDLNDDPSHTSSSSSTSSSSPSYINIHGMGNEDLEFSANTANTPTFPFREEDLSHIPQHLLDLTPPPTRGRSNAFYSKPLPPLIHSHSDGAAIVAAQQSAALAAAAASSSTISPRRNTTMGLSLTPTIPEPSYSGISKPKMFNYWRSLTNPNNNERAILSHSKRFLVGFAETIGRRPSMEDCMVVHGAFRGRGHEDYFALFDGHGGRDAAEFAATHLHEILAEKLKTNNPVKSLKEAFKDTHDLISDQKIIGGTTAVVALFIGKKGFIANVGDTRAVLCRDGVPLRVSLDHKPELPEEMSRIRKLGGTVTTTYNSAGQATSRVNGMLAVSRALGDTVLHPYVSCQPEIHGPLNLDTPAKDQFVVLACDGVWDVLSDEEATRIVAPIANPEMASRRLRDEAFARGSTDNISVMVIRCPPFVPCD